MPQSVGSSVGAAPGVYFSVNAGDVPLDSLDAQNQFLRHLLAAFANRNEAQYIDLPASQPIRWI